MKKPHFSILVLITALFAIFLLGFFLGRQTGTVPVRVSRTAAEQAETQPSSEANQAETPFPIDINSATAGELTALPGIGEVLAARIVAYRDEFGNFLSIEELADVRGIDEKKIETIRQYVTIGG